MDQCWTQYELRREKTGFFAYAKTKTQISFALTAKLIRVFDFATLIVQYLFFLNLNFKSLAILSDYAARFVSSLVENPEDRFSDVAAHIIIQDWFSTLIIPLFE